MDSALTGRRRLLLGLALGVAIGVAWVMWYTPLALSWPWVAGLHLLAALAIERTQWLGGIRSFTATWMALLLGLFLVPWWVSAFTVPGILSGLQGYGIAAAAVLAGLAVGTLCGALVARGGGARVLGAFVLLATVAAMALSGRSVAGRYLASEQPRALRVIQDFPETKVAFIGIDGADWAVIDRLVEEGHLPAMKALLGEGRRGTLRSIQPPFSPVVWSTIFSGTLPQKHGLVDWYTADARNRRVPMLWDIFDAHDRRSLTVNVPGSWPPTTLRNGAFIAGFPIPGLVTGSPRQLLGMVLTSRAQTGLVDTHMMPSLGPGRFSVDVPLALPDLRPRFSGLGHAFIDLAVRQLILPVESHRLRFTLTVIGNHVRLEGDIFPEAVELEPGDWSGWLRIPLGDTDARTRLHLLHATGDEVTLYMLPPVQAPERPRFPFATGFEAKADFFSTDPPYVVEGVGWISYPDPRVASLLPAALQEVERNRAMAVLRLLDAGFPDVFSYVLTLTDRIQHPFLGVHHSARTVGRRPWATTEHEPDPVLEAWKLIDELLGELLQRIPRDALLFIASDHGFMPSGPGGVHRMEGIWYARGPMIALDNAELEMSAVDVLPTMLHCIGAPVAEDFDGVVHSDLCPSSGPTWTVETLLDRSAGSSLQTEAVIDRSREEQLKSLGYVN